MSGAATPPARDSSARAGRGLAGIAAALLVLGAAAAGASPRPGASCCTRRAQPGSVDVVETRRPRAGRAAEAPRG